MIYDIIKNDSTGELAAQPSGDPIPSGWTLQVITISPEFYLNPQPAAERLISKLAFLNRFTEGEAVAIDIAQQYNPTATQSEQEVAAALRYHQRKFDAAKYIDLNSTMVSDALSHMETMGLLASGRANEIISANIAAEELP